VFLGWRSPRPLRNLRLAVTIPPRHWFGGIDYRFAVDMARELRRMGAAILEIDVSVFDERDPRRIRNCVAAVRSFRPDVAVALPNAGYAIACKTPAGDNLFRDVLELSTILIWDHGVLQFAPALLDPLPAAPAQSIDGCLRRLRNQLDHPVWVHYSPDRGHIAVMDSLCILAGHNVRDFVQPAWPAYVRQAERAATRSGSTLAFAGNVYLDSAQHLEFRKQPFLAGIEARMLASKRANLAAPFWQLLAAELDSLPSVDRAAFHLHPDASFFWTFVHGEIEAVGTTEARLHALSALRRPCDFFGNLVEPHMTPQLEARGLRFRGSLDCVADLPSLYQNTDLLIDVVHPGYISGTSPKITACFAAGGTVLFDYKDDFRLALGDLADAVMYRSIDEMNSLVETYLADPHKKQAVARELQQRVLRDFSFAALWERILITEPVWRESRHSLVARPATAVPTAH